MLQCEKKQKFEALVGNAAKCNLCQRMHDRTKVLSERNGSLDARVMFIAEAPGRLGADRTLIPLHGDQTGRNFERLLSFSGLTRNEIFITNAVLCNPRDERGNNVTPVCREIRNCSLHLSLVISIVQPDLLVPLGLSALAALNAIEPHSIGLQRDVRKLFKWGSYSILPLYHPGPRVFIHRSLGDQISDFCAVAEYVGRGLSKAADSHKPLTIQVDEVGLSLLPA